MTSPGFDDQGINHCGHEGEVLTEDPFIWEVENEIVMVYLCPNCFTSRKEDV